MVENRWQIVVGSVILLLMLLAGAFSLGVYVGEHGWTRRGLTYQPDPGAVPQGAPGQPQGQAPGQGQLPGQDGARPAVIGRILDISSEGLELATQEGRRRVELHDQTVYLELNGPTLQLTDLAVADIVAIYGEMIAGDGGRLLAQVVVRLPPNPPAAQ
jgi:hypothetical protein